MAAGLIVLNFAANALCNGTRLQHLELLRNNAAFLDAIGADSIPDPTTAGDFCRRFRQSDIDDLLLAINETRLNLWKQQEASFFERAIIDVYGVIVATKGEHLSDQENLIAQLSGGVRSLCAPVDNLLSNWA